MCKGSTVIKKNDYNRNGICSQHKINAALYRSKLYLPGIKVLIIIGDLLIVHDWVVGTSCTEYTEVYREKGWGCKWYLRLLVTVLHTKHYIMIP